MKIVIIGGGSAYMASLFQGLVAMKNVFDSAEVVLVDIDMLHLDLMLRLGKMMLDLGGANIRLRATEHRLEALKNADFVLTTFRPGGLPARHLDESVPLRYGVIGHETIGPGGLFMACRSIPVMLEIAKEVEHVCPKAIIVNYTNPTALVTGAVKRYSNAKIVGICDQHVGERRAVAKLLDVPHDAVWTNSVGLNHATWVTSLYVYRDEMLIEFCDHLRAGLYKTNDKSLNYTLEIAKIFSLIPTTYFRYYYFGEQMLSEVQGNTVTRAEEIMAELPDIWTSYEEAIQEKRFVPRHQRGGSDHGEFALEVIAALMGEQDKTLIVNTVNGDALPDFPSNSIVEMPCVVSQRGVRPLSQDPLPRSVTGLLQSIAAYEDLAIEAAVHGDEHLLFQALIAHPLVRTIERASNLARDLLEVHQHDLPQFN